MDKWRFFAITHRDHVIMNPVSAEALDEVLKIASIPANAQVLDIGCGKGELLVRLARLGAKTGIGVKLSPYTVREARERVRSVTPNSETHLLPLRSAVRCAGAKERLSNYASRPNGCARRIYAKRY